MNRDQFERLSELTPEERALLMLRLRNRASQRAASVTLAPAIERVARDEEMPLSYAQQRLWFIDQLEPGSAAYNIPCAVWLRGRLNVAALRSSLSEIVRRHEVLRTSFPAQGGKPTQRISEAVAVGLAEIDVRGLGAVDREEQRRRVMREEGRRGFDLGSGPLIREKLVRIGEEEHLLVVSMHHIVSDGWSMEVMVKEIGEEYEASGRGEGRGAAEQEAQYVDYAVWQRQWLRGERLEQQLQYWRQQLAGAPPVLELPVDRPRPAVRGISGAQQSFSLSKELTRQLKSLGNVEGVTLFMTLAGAFNVLLYRYTGQEDISIGTPIANRNRKEIEGLIGFFVNMLVLRSSLSGSSTFKEFLKQVREVALGAYAHQNLPFEKLVEELQPERSLSHAPLYQVAFTLQNFPTRSLQLSGLTLSQLQMDSQPAKNDLALEMADSANGLGGRFIYNTDLFDMATISRMLRHFGALLGEIASHPDRQIFDFPLLFEAERNQILIEWNDSATDDEAECCVHRMFEAQVERTPFATLVFEREHLTYRELNRRANQLAHYLRGLGVGPDMLVGVCVERSFEMIIGLMGILKAGGGYVPLDPEYPDERLKLMLEDSHMSVLLTQNRLAGRFSGSTPLLVCPDSDWEIISQHSDQNLSGETTAENLAYVIYTSGSTGRPKGVMVPHRAISNHLLWRQSALALDQQDRFLAKASISFDIAVWEIFGTLLSGAGLVLARPGGQQDRAYLRNLINEQEVTVIHFNPSMLQAFLREKGVEGCISLRRVFCGGEAMPVDLQEQCASLPRAELFNQYGPTETTVDIAIRRCEELVDGRTVPIGRPIANTQLYVLAPHLEPVPVGSPGELHAGGACLARGYLDQPDLTASKFIPNPFCQRLGERLYKTGDLARHLPDGNIEYLRRSDYQVKIRGFRIELEEIDARLRQHAAVQESVTVAQGDEPDNKQVVAYIICDRLPVPTTSELRHYLKQKLPEYMIPSAFVMLDSFPLTINGKVDRRALPARNPARPELTGSYVAPRTLVEDELAKIWQELLNIRQVGVYDNFFDLGGHSLLLTQLASRIRAAFRVELPLRSLFEKPTVVEMTLEIAARQVEQEDGEEVSQFLRELKELSPDQIKALLKAEGLADAH